VPKVRVNSFAVSLDGYAAGPNQSRENPLGVRGPELFEWFFSTRTWKQMHGCEGGSTGVDNEWAQRGMENVGAWILGRKMFGPVRGPWPEKDKDVRIGGGVATIQQYLRARLIDELHLAFRPVLMGSGENLFTGIDLAELGYRCIEHVSTELAMHVVLKNDK
jgi:dihydrofolate reductase